MYLHTLAANAGKLTTAAPAPAAPDPAPDAA